MKPFVGTLFFIFCCSLLNATIYFVKPGGTGDGLSWENATGQLAEVMLQAEPGDEIWVAEGIYKPTETTDRSISFILKEGVRMYGGFAGVETLRDQRNWTQKDLAQRLDVSRQSVNAIETGKYDPSLPLAFRIADVFALPIEQIFLRN